jgi:hypothetical protein
VKGFLTPALLTKSLHEIFQYILSFV